MILSSVTLWSERETVHRGGSGGVCGQALRVHLTHHLLHVVQATSKRVSGNLPSTVHPGVKIENKPGLFPEKVAFQSKQPQPRECLSSSPPVSGHTQATNSQTWPLSGLMPLASGSLTPPSWFLSGGQRRTYRRSSSRAVWTLSHKSWF